MTHFTLTPTLFACTSRSHTATMKYDNWVSPELSRFSVVQRDTSDRVPTAVPAFLTVEEVFDGANPQEGKQLKI